ncbi:MAG: ArnT family glycosyltransferase, partial [Pyrinomonadaceae bacterium]
MPEITKTDEKAAGSLPLTIWFMLAASALFMFFIGLDVAFFGPDEPRYAQVGREMFERRDWVTPTLGGFNWFEKPALLYWLEIASFSVFGVSEVAARLGPALFGIGTVASLWFLGRSTDAEGRAGRAQFAAWLSLISGSTLGLIVFSRAASFDIIITFPITAALVSFFIFDRSKETRLLPLVLFYVFIGVALLAKGLIGIVFPTATVAFFYVLSRRLPGRTFLVSLLWGTLVSLAIAAAWYVPMYLRHGYAFIDEFFLQHHFQRFTSNKYQHTQPFYFFFCVLPLMTLPWLPFFLVGVWKSLSGAVRGLRSLPTSSPSSFSPLMVFAFSWLIVPLVFFSFSGSKLPGYILPAVPAAVVISSVYIFDLVSRSG